jgi:hypothetical protein
MPSSLIRAMAYDADSCVLSVWFTTTPDFAKGQFFNKVIRGRFPYEIAQQRA